MDIKILIFDLSWGSLVVTPACWQARPLMCHQMELNEGGKLHVFGLHDKAALAALARPMSYLLHSPGLDKPSASRTCNDVQESTGCVTRWSVRHGSKYKYNKRGLDILPHYSEQCFAAVFSRIH